MRNAEWIAAHFEELVNQYGGTYVAVGRGRLLATGKEAPEVLRLASREVPEEEVSLFKVPRLEELVCALRLFPT
jgi:hypothetical protein